MANYFFGELEGHPVGSTYPNRAAAKDAGVHQVTQQGIAGNRKVGCASIVLSGGYSTDDDRGHEIFYTGAGGQDPNDRSKHVAHQDLDKSGNAALLKSEETGKPIRIVRGSNHVGPNPPPAGYRYDGLYKVMKHYAYDPGDGWRRWMFQLVQLSPEEAASFTPPANVNANREAYRTLGLGSGSIAEDSGLNAASSERVDPFYDAPATVVLPEGRTAPGTKVVVSQRVIRDTKVTAAVKSLYRDACQACGTQVVTRVGRYSEGAHIRPVGRPHYGPDTMDNILCLCPNHHAAFDKGGIYLTDDLGVRDQADGFIASLTVHADHAIDLNHVRYHRAHHGHPDDVTSHQS